MAILAPHASVYALPGGICAAIWLTAGFQALLFSRQGLFPKRPADTSDARRRWQTALPWIARRVRTVYRDNGRVRATETDDSYPDGRDRSLSAFTVFQTFAHIGFESVAIGYAVAISFASVAQWWWTLRETGIDCSIFSAMTQQRRMIREGECHGAAGVGWLNRYRIPSLRSKPASG